MTTVIPTFGNTFPDLARSVVGFDTMFEEMTKNVLNNSSFPPHNIIKIDEEHFKIELAVAGWKQEEIDLKEHKGNLTIKGTKDKQDTNYVHKGIGYRNWIKDFKLAEHMVVDKAKLENGILSVDMHIKIPEELKPRQIPLENPTLISHAS